MNRLKFITPIIVLLSVFAIIGCNTSKVGSSSLFGLDAVDTIEANLTTEAATQEAVKNEISVIDSIIENHDAKEAAEAILDTITKSAIADSIISKADSIGKDSLLTSLDSLKAKFDAEHGINNSKAIQWNDSVAAAEDSIRKNSKKSVLEAPVEYEAKDSVVFFMNTKNAFLYGDSHVKYQNIDLKAEQITMDMDSSLIHAVGVADSTGKKIGEPVFKEGNDEYESEKMSYNFKTKKGFITNVYTAQQDGFLTSEESKKGADNEMYLRHGRYTTCDEEHPHFYIALSRAKAHPGKDVFFGPAWLVVEDVPLPLAIPFGFFPFTSSYSSGFIMPTYGDESTRGFYLRDGGYYFALSDNMDLKLTGEIYTKGSWGIGAQTTYKKRYKYSGNFYFNYQVTKEGEKNMPDYMATKNFKVQWSHRTDSKSSPNSSFSASVNFATQSYEKNNLTSLYNPQSYSQSTRTSSISYSRNFQKIGLSLSSSFNISQNMRDSSIALTMPSLSLSLSRFYPFKKKKAAGKEKWYEKIAMNYTGSLSNSINTKEDMLMSSSLIKDWKNGMKHNIPVSASFNILKYINVTPSFNYTERWYTNKIEQTWDQVNQAVRRDTVYGFNRVFDYNLSLSANTKVYGFYKPNPKVFGKKIEMVRHVITPQVSFSYAPDFGDGKWGYWKTYTKTDAEGNVSLVSYSPYTGSLYGTPSQGKTGSLSFDLSNNVEMKVKDRNDSIKKVSIIDELGASLSYNMAAKRQPWSNLSTRIRLKWGKTTFNMNAVFNTYAYEFDQNGNVVVGDRTEWSYGRFGRFQGMSKNLSYTFNNQSFKTIKQSILKLLGRGDEIEDKAKNKEDNEDDDDEDITEDVSENKVIGRRDKNDNSTEGLDEDGYMQFRLPWSFSISYGISMAEDRTGKINIKSMRYPYKFTQNLNFSGNLKLSNNWNCNFSSGWDFTMKKISMTTVNITRDMHCFNVSCGLVFGTFTSYHISMRANASTLTDALKYDKKSSYNSSIQWY